MSPKQPSKTSALFHWIGIFAQSKMLFAFRLCFVLDFCLSALVLRHNTRFITLSLSSFLFPYCSLTFSQTTLHTSIVRNKTKCADISFHVSDNASKLSVRMKFSRSAIYSAATLRYLHETQCHTLDREMLAVGRLS